ncbi:hypothetical protein PDESU_01659 [Pontiella desulfatans]|uniref:PEP-CTERM protein-sorting domain-containing protein n=1 Tax=Pontiella desulfatans TaxID=2750659 RepID=A0A6C2TZS1_PONDE|nr:PEP-CTERM sorting domain-containing protein [Pontiella desulfatans]VGO13105.1 hypothetical protein PDESU_01659 [Pontiella desulfatans]
MNKKMMILMAVINAVVLTAGASIISDNFNDGDVGSNQWGDGTGFYKFDTGTNLKYVESSGQLDIYDTATAAKSVGIHSKDKFDALAGEGVTATFVTKGIGYLNKANYASFFLGNGALTTPGMTGGIMVIVDNDYKDAQGEHKYKIIGKAGGTKEYLLKDWTNTNLDLSKNFTLSLSINPDGNSGQGNWNIDWSGTGAGHNSTANFNDGTGSTKNTFFTGDVSVGTGYRTGTDTGGDSTRIKLDSVTVIPEPAALGLIGVAGGVLLFFRRRLQN